MKCIRCKTDNNLKERTANNGSCKKCGHPFAFEPITMKSNVRITDSFFTKVIADISTAFEPTTMKSNVRFTDLFFAKAIAEISTNETIFFTPKQFLYFLDRRLKSRHGKFGFEFWFFYALFGVGITVYVGMFLSEAIGDIAFYIVPVVLNLIFIFYLSQVINSKKTSNRGRKNSGRSLLILGVIISIVGGYISWTIPNSNIILALALILGLLSFVLGVIQLSSKENKPQIFLVTETEVRQWLARWTRANGEVKKILPYPRQESLPVQISSDITAYSFDRVVVCDSAASAQFLISNNFHFENNCAVLSITGYPQSIFQTVLEMLRRNPNLKVYALHNASPRGINLVNHLQTSSNWFSDTDAVIYDLGVFPRQVFKTSNIFVQNSQESSQQARKISPQIRPKLTSEEIKWLELGNFVELESFLPQKLLQIVTQGINKITNSDDGDYDKIVFEDNNSTIYFYSRDSFG